MNILQISTTEAGGGAAKVPYELHLAYQALGHNAMMAVGYRRGKPTEGIFEIPNDAHRGLAARAFYRIPEFLKQRKMRGETFFRSRLVSLAEPRRAQRLREGYEDFDFPGTHKLMDLAPHNPEIVHCHNLHGSYFDLHYLAELSSRVPVIMTLHDMWTFTGHCAYSIDCNRWEQGCGDCPRLDLYPAITQDQSRANLETKRSIYSNSNLVVVGPCQWVVDLAKRSVLKVTEYQVIPYGLDLSVFNDRGRDDARRSLGIESGANVVLFAASRGQENPYKDFSTIQRVYETLLNSPDKKELLFIILGGRKDEVQNFGNFQIRHYRYRSKPEDVAAFYKAADIFLHAANADTFPNTVLEAQACGTPVIATGVGGIPEQVAHGETGYIVPPRDSAGMVKHIEQLFAQKETLHHMGSRAAERAKTLYELQRQTRDYLALYERLIAMRRS
ncbi:MAG: glycosyltransferase [Verrucomicrobiota bacterium]